MSEDDEVPDELWDMIDTLGQNKQQTLSTQAPSAAPQQYITAPKAPVQPYQPHGLPTWRPGHSQQLPLAPPPKPTSLAQQLAGTGNFLRSPAPSIQQTPNLSNGFPRYGNQQQHQQTWQQRQPWSGSSWAQQQHSNQQTPQQPLQQGPEQQISHLHAVNFNPAAAASSAQQGAAGDSIAGTSDASTTAAAAAAAAGSLAGNTFNEHATQSLTPRRLQQEVERLRLDLAAQAGMATQLRSKLSLAEQEKQHLQQRVQQQHQPINSIAQHTAQDLKKQVDTMQQRLMFAEQELSEAHKKAKDKESKATEAETRLKQLQDELRKRDEQMLQIQFELEQEKQRAERLAANPPTAAAAVAGSSAEAAQPKPSQSAAGVSGMGGRLIFSTPGSSGGGGRKRRFNPGGTTTAAAAGTPQSTFDGTSRAGSGVNASQQQVTPLQQHQMQMQHLLHGRPSASKPQQQQQHQQQQQQMLMEDPEPIEGDVPQQQLMQVDQDLHAQQQEARLRADQVQQQTQQQQQQQSGMIELLSAMQQCQVQTASLSSILWCSCKSALQQLLQPLASQIPASLTSSSSSSAHPAGITAAVGSPQRAACGRVLSVLANVQQQLQALLAGSNSGSGTELLLQLLRLAAVLFPMGGLGVGDVFISSSTNVVVAAQLAAAAAAGDSGSSRGWVLQQPDSHSNSVDVANLPQQQQQYLVFQAVDDPQVVHVLLLQLAIAVLQLLQGLLLHDSSCLVLVAAAVGAPQVPHKQDLLSYDIQRHDSDNSKYTTVEGQGNAALLCTVTTSSSSNGRAAFLAKGGSYSRRSAAHDRQAGAAATVSYWTAAEAAIASVVQLQHSSSSSSVSQLRASGASRFKDINSTDVALLQQQQQQPRTLYALLADACRSHVALHTHVGALLAALAARLPASLQQLLLPAVADSSLVIQLLHSEGYEQRCQAVAVLQQMLLSSGVAVAFAAALGRSNSTAAAGGGDAVDGASDAPMPLAPLQPANRGISYTQRSNRAAAKAAVAAAFQDKPQQQQQQQSGSLEDTSALSQLSHLSDQAVYDVLYGLLECIAAGLGDLPRHNHHTSSSPMDFSSSDSIGSSSSAGWGTFEMQRRACAAVAAMLQTKQEAMLQVMLDLSFTSGFGLAQRLLALVEAACSAQGGDPFSAAVPKPPPPAASTLHTSTAAAELSCLKSASRSNQADNAANSVTGAMCEWSECLERVRVAHESLLLLRALMATGGVVGQAATADICSNMTSIRMVQTTRAKLSEWSEAVLTTAAAAASQGAHMQCTYSASSPAAAANASGTGSAAAAAGLPLATWAWSYSSSCGCRDKHSSNTGMRVSRSSGPALSSVAEHVLRSQRPLLQDCFLEISSAAASVHRRAIQYLC